MLATPWMLLAHILVFHLIPLLNVVQMGSEELKKDVIQVKDLELGAKISRQIKTHEEWKHQPAQVEIKRDKLIEYITKLPK